MGDTKKELLHRLASMRADQRDDLMWARKAMRNGDYADAIAHNTHAEYLRGRIEELTLRLEDLDG